MGKSITNSIYDLGAAFFIAERVLGSGRKWNAENEQQKRFGPMLKAVLPFVDRLMAEDVLKANVSWKAADINDWFKQNGFNITLEQQPDPDTFYAGGIYEQLVRWAFEGKKSPLKGANGHTYKDAVEMEMGATFFNASSTTEGIARIGIQDTNDLVFMVKLDNPSKDPFGLLLQAQTLERQLKPSYSFEGLRFPMVDIDNKTSLNWLVNFWTNSSTGRKATVTEAVQQTIFKMNEKGALAKSGAGISVSLEAFHEPHPPLVIDSPFLFWISRQGLPFPLFATWADYSDWKNPGELK